MQGTLYLVATPIDPDSMLVPDTKQALLKAYHKQDLIVVEDAKPARRRWIAWGLPREAIDHFAYYNEHSKPCDLDSFVSKLRSGRNLYLLSDCGLPAFCDPGQQLVDRCHQLQIPVSATPFANSVLLALAMSGFYHQQFYFAGFPPSKQQQRSDCLKKIIHHPQVTLVMDTPYRMKSLISGLLEVAGVDIGRRLAFLAMDLNKKTQEYRRLPLNQLRDIRVEGKKEFILILDRLKQ